MKILELYYNPKNEQYEVKLPEELSQSQATVHMLRAITQMQQTYEELLQQCESDGDEEYYQKQGDFDD